MFRKASHLEHKGTASNRAVPFSGSVKNRRYGDGLRKWLVSIPGHIESRLASLYGIYLCLSGHRFLNRVSGHVAHIERIMVVWTYRKRFFILRLSL